MSNNAITRDEINAAHESATKLIERMAGHVAKLQQGINRLMLSIPSDGVALSMLGDAYHRMNVLGDLLNEVDAVEPEDAAAADVTFAEVQRVLGLPEVELE